MTIGRKNDTAKARWDILPWEAMSLVVDVMTFGAAKYGEYNWKYIDDYRRRYFAAAMRHIVAWKRGDYADTESGMPHIAHAVCCLLFILALDSQKEDP